MNTNAGSRNRHAPSLHLPLFHLSSLPSTPLADAEDVWAFAVFAWEVLCDGVRATTGTLEWPEQVPVVYPKLETILTRCWQAPLAERPSFPELVQVMQ